MNAYARSQTGRSGQQETSTASRLLIHSRPDAVPNLRLQLPFVNEDRRLDFGDEVEVRGHAGPVPTL